MSTQECVGLSARDVIVEIEKVRRTLNLEHTFCNTVPARGAPRGVVQGFPNVIWFDKNFRPQKFPPFFIPHAQKPFETTRTRMKIDYPISGKSTRDMAQSVRQESTNGKGREEARGTTTF